MANDQFNFNEGDEGFKLRRSVGLFLSLFLAAVISGSLLSNLFTSRRLQDLVLSQLTKAAPDIMWDMKGLRVVLSRHGLPILGLEADELRAVRGGGCETSLSVVAQDAFLKMSLWSLVKGPVQLGNIQSSKVEIVDWPAIVGCGDSKSARADLFPLILESVRIHFQGADEYEVQARVNLDPNHKYRLSPFRIWARTGTKADLLDFTLDWREAHIEGHLEGLRGSTPKGAGFGRKVPVDETYKVLKLLGVVKNPVDMGSNWADFQISWERGEPLKFSSIALGGDIGDVRIPALVLGIEPRVVLEPFEADIHKANLSEFVRIFDIDSIRRVTTDPGYLVGKLNYQEHLLEFLGRLEQTQILFARNGRKTSQTIKHIALDVEYEVGRRISAKLDQPAFERGDFGGTLSMEYDVPKQQADFKMGIQKLNLDQNVATVLYGIRVGEISGEVLARMEGPELTNLKGRVDVNSAEGEGWGLQNGELRFLYANRKGSGSFSAKTLEFEKSQLPVVQILESLHKGGKTTLTDIEANVEFEKQEYRISPARFRYLPGQGTGKLSARVADELSGVLDLELPKLGRLSWALGGALEAITISPLDQGTQEVQKSVLVEKTTAFDTLRRLLKRNN